VIDVTLGETSYRVEATGQGSQWSATATRQDIGERFGPEIAAASQREAVDRMVRWLSWQHEHSEALASLQQAERAYHRGVVAGSTSAVIADDPAVGDMRRDSLEAVEAARRHLDAVRARRPLF
jgi:hypothetical protein